VVSILEKFHSSELFGCHAGRDKVLQSIKKEGFFWHTMNKDVCEYIKKCDKCQHWKRSVVQPPLQPILASEPLERLMIDFTDVGTDSFGMRYLLLVIDVFTKYVIAWMYNHIRFMWGQAFQTKSTDNVTVYLMNLFSIEGFPKELQSDNGGEFTSSVIENVLEKCNVNHIKITPYHPQSDGQVERLNHTIKTKLAMMVSESNQAWSTCLPFVLHSYNKQIHSTTKYTPYEALRGRTPTVNITNASKQELLLQRAVLLQSIKENSTKAAEKSIQRHAKKCKVINYKVGDIVLVKPLKVSKSKQKGPMYKYKAEIVKANRNFTYRLRWITDGPTQKEKAKTESLRCWPSRCFKLIENEKAENESELEKSTDRIEEDNGEERRFATEIRKRKRNVKRRRRRVVSEEG
jgi:transposase InsO family protein